MHNAVWKMTAMAGVIGIGLLVLLQVQQSLTPLQIASPIGQNLDEFDLTGSSTATDDAAAAAVEPAPFEPSLDALPLQAQSSVVDPVPTRDYEIPARQPLDFRTDATIPAASQNARSAAPAAVVPAASSSAPAPAAARWTVPAVEADPFASDPAPPRLAGANDADLAFPDDEPLSADQPTDPFAAEPSSAPQPAPGAFDFDDEYGNALQPGAPVVDADPFALDEPAPLTLDEDFEADELVERPALPRLHEPATGASDDDDELGFDFGQELNEPAELTLEGADAAEAPARVPQPLDPPARAAALETIGAEDLRGDGTVRDDAPRGPQQPQLQIEKVAPPRAVLGQPLIYSVIVRNVGGSPAQQVVVEDRIPKGTELEGTHPQAEMIGKRLMWRIGTLAPGDERKISIKVIPFEEGQIGSIATVNFVAEVSAQTVVTAPQLTLALSAPAQAKLGEQVELRFTLKNTGNGDATNVVLRNIIPEGLRHPAGADLEYAVDVLPAGQEREIQLSVMTSHPGRVVNQAIVTADGNVSLAEQVAIDVVAARLSVARTAPERLYVGRASVFGTTVKNSGNLAVQQVVVEEYVPRGVDFVIASDNGRFDEGQRKVIWKLERLAPGEERLLRVKLQPQTAGEHATTVTAVAAGGTLARLDATLAVEGFAALSVEGLDGQPPVAVGEKVSSRIRVRNQGTGTARNVTFQLVLPAEVTLESASAPVRYMQQGSTVQFEPIPELSPGAEVAIEVVLQTIAEGDARVQLRMSADHLSRPVGREEAIRIFAP